MKYRSLAPLGTALVALVAVILVAALGEAVIVYLWNFHATDHETWAQFQRLEALRLLVLRPIIYVAMALTFTFVFLATRNLSAIGPARPSFSPGMAVLWFFIPIGNIVMIHQVMTALWRESQPTPSKSVRAGLDFSVPLVTAWWAVFAAGTVLTLAFGNEHLTTPWAFVARSWTSVAVRFVSGACFIAIVRGVATRQREQWNDLERRSAIPQPTASALR